jgi:hypothetical protein
VEGWSSRLFWIEASLAAVSGVLCSLTVVWKDWIEILFGFDPDRHDGSLESLVALGFLTIAVGFAALARRERGRASRPAAG